MAWIGPSFYPTYYGASPYWYSAPPPPPVPYYPAPPVWGPPPPPPAPPIAPPPPPAAISQPPAPAALKEVKASHILVKSQEEASRYRAQILSGQARFEDIAAKVSQCPSGKSGGDLGFFERGQMVPEFDQVAFKLPKGVVSEPIKTEFGWHLIKVTDQR